MGHLTFKIVKRIAALSADCHGLVSLAEHNLLYSAGICFFSKFKGQCYLLILFSFSLRDGIDLNKKVLLATIANLLRGNRATCPIFCQPPFHSSFHRIYKAVKVDLIAFLDSLRQKDNLKFRFQIRIKKVAAPHQKGRLSKR
jgi:hypothetical protein